MKTLKATIFIILLSMSDTHTFGQSVGISADKLNSLVVSFVKELQSNNIDTICIYKNYYNGRTFGANEDDCTNYCDIFIPTYVLWFYNGKTFLHKKDNCNNYNTIEIDAKYVWKIFFKYQQQIQKEKVKIFEYDFNKERYIKLDVHTYVRQFSIHTEGEVITMWFRDLNMKEESDGYKNINYSYNQNLKATILINKLEELIQKIENDNLLIKESVHCYPVKLGGFEISQVEHHQTRR